MDFKSFTIEAIKRTNTPKSPLSPPQVKSLIQKRLTGNIKEDYYHITTSEWDSHFDAVFNCFDTRLMVSQT